jgi:hypothetical protein
MRQRWTWSCIFSASQRMTMTTPPPQASQPPSASMTRSPGAAIATGFRSVVAITLSEDLARHLPSRRKQRCPRNSRRSRGLDFPPDRSIHERPDYVNTRETFSEWEGDLMIFERAQGKTNVASLVERKTRSTVLFRNNDRSTTRLMNRLMSVMDAPAPTSPQVHHTRSWHRVQELAQDPTRDWNRSLVLRPAGTLAKGICRESEQASTVARAIADQDRLRLGDALQYDRATHPRAASCRAVPQPPRAGSVADRNQRTEKDTAMKQLWFELPILAIWLGQSQRITTAYFNILRRVGYKS